MSVFTRISPKVISPSTNFEFPTKGHLPIGQVKNRIHQFDSKIHQPWAIGHYFLCTLVCKITWYPTFVVAFWVHSPEKCQVFFLTRRLPPLAKQVKNWKKIRKKLRYFRLLPNLAQRKLIDLANHLPSSSPCGLLTVTHRAFENVEFYGESRGIFVSQFCEECKLVSTNVNQIQVKQTILKDFGG